MKNSIENLPDVNRILTPMANAIEEMRMRKLDDSLLQSVNEFFDSNIPNHFKSDTPLLYLSRHIATPNFETLHAIKIAKDNDVTLIIGEDPNDKFVSNNFLKKSLGKLTIITGKAKNGDPIIENTTIVDFNSYSGQPFNKVLTRSGTLLVDVHKFLMSKYRDSRVVVSNESNWVGEYHKGDIIEYYKMFLSLMIVHGIMLEFYAVEDSEFVDEVLAPAFNFVESKFGHKPLICGLIEPEQEFKKNWLAYPKEVKGYLNELTEVNK